MTEEQQWAKGLALQRMIWAALLMGAVTFLGVFVFLGLQPAKPGPAGGKPQDGLLSSMAVAMATFALVASFVLPSALTKAAALKAPPNPPAADLVGLWQNESIIRWALLEGGAMMGGVAFFLEKLPWALAGSAVLLLALAACFPTMARRDAFLARIGHGRSDGPLLAGGDEQLDALRPRGE